jgi:hypothetical protein
MNNPGLTCLTNNLALDISMITQHQDVAKIKRCVAGFLK